MMAANIPIVRGVDPPAALFGVEPWKIVGLTIEAERLAEIRRRRVARDRRRLRRALRRPVGDLRGAGGDREAAQAARLPGDRRLPAGDRGVRLALRRARRGAPPGVPGGRRTLSTRWVYDFSDGTADMRPLLGGKGANLAEMTRIGLPVPDGFTITTEACVAYLREDGRPGRAGRAGRRAPGHARGAVRQAARRPQRPAAGVGAVGRRVLDAGHDGHDPQPGAERRDGARAGRGGRRRAVRATTPTGASSRCSGTWSPASTPTCSRTRCSG